MGVGILVEVGVGVAVGDGVVLARVGEGVEGVGVGVFPITAACVDTVGVAVGSGATLFVVPVLPPEPIPIMAMTTNVQNHHRLRIGFFCFAGDGVLEVLGMGVCGGAPVGCSSIRLPSGCYYSN